MAAGLTGPQPISEQKCRVTGWCTQIVACCITGCTSLHGLGQASKLALQRAAAVCCSAHDTRLAGADCRAATGNVPACSKTARMHHQFLRYRMRNAAGCMQVHQGVEPPTALAPMRRRCATRRGWLDVLTPFRDPCLSTAVISVRCVREAARSAVTRVRYYGAGGGGAPAAAGLAHQQSQWLQH